MDDANRFRLLYGPYRQPRYTLGDKLFCVLRGWVKVTRVSDALIPWPMTTKQGGKPSLIVCDSLVSAVQRESEIAVAHWWGVSIQTVWKWRKALGVPQVNEGTARLYQDYTPERLDDEARRKAQAKARDPQRRAKIAAAKRGKPRPRQVVEAMSAARLGKHATEETRRKMSAAHRRRGTRPPNAGRAWTAEEDGLLGTLPDEEVARRTSRTLGAVRCRRALLDIDGFYRKRQRQPRHRQQLAIRDH